LARSFLTVRKFLFIFLAWWLVWAGLQVMLLMSFGITMEIALTDSIVTNVLLALACGLVNNNMQYYLPKRERYWYILFISLGLSGLILLACKGILTNALSKHTDYVLFFSKSLAVRFDMAFLLIGCMTILSVLWYTIEEENENQKRKTDAERYAKEAELYKLRQQLQPHFLFNSLNSISALIGTQPEHARKMIHQLSDFLRGTLKKEEQQWVNLAEELQYLQLYLDIEKVRFGHRLTTTIESNDTTGSMKLPPMLLQPIVENAIKFGLYDTTEDITISIKATTEDKYLQIAVQNPFDPETSNPKKGTGFGLSSVQRRLYLLFARNDLLETKADNNIFTITIKIPQV
jgi:two-component system LytT family sensor kinase